MRDEKRIKVILNKIEQIWNDHPDLRFHQLLINIGLMKDDNEFWHIEDNIVIMHLNDKKKWWNKTNKTKIRKKYKDKD